MQKKVTHLKNINKIAVHVSLSVIALLAYLLCSAAWAVSLSTYRIYLDQETRESSIILTNRDSKAEQCALNLRHFSYDQFGMMSVYQGDSLPDNAADNLIRYSPKNVTVTPANSQTIRFMIRRKPNNQAAEYRAYLEVDCDVQDDNTGKEMISIVPKLLLNVPIVVRTGKLDVDAKFINFKIQEGNLSFDIKRSGERSLYGDIEIINKQNNEVIDIKRSVSIYPETTSKSFTFLTQGLEAEQLSVKFVEDKNYGGEKSFEQDVIIRM